MKSMVISSSPHIKAKENLSDIMYDVVIALIPATLLSIYFFGWHVLITISLCVVFSVLFESSYLRIAGKPNNWRTALDGSAIVTGLLLALNLPPVSPWWMVIIGCFAAIIIAKHLFGGLGFNIFNPALVGRVFLLISFPVQMTYWTLPTFWKTDAVTAATPLGLLKTEGLKAVNQMYAPTDYFLGVIGGSMGEVSGIALLIGAAYLFYKKIISWEIPLSMLGSLAILTGIFWLIDPTQYASPYFHLMTGGAMLGAFFMATDMVTSPLTRAGMLIFGFGIGLLTGLIRLFGGYPEGVSFAILIMNGCVPLIDQYTKAKKFGLVR